MNSKRTTLLSIVLGALLVVILGALLAWLSGMPFWAAFGIAAVALVINGTIAEHEDRWPGGFLNPRDKSK